MTSQIAQMHPDAYLQGLALSEAIFQMADDNDMQEYNESSKAPSRKAPGKNAGTLDILNAAFDGLQEMSLRQYRREDIEKVLKNRLLQSIKKGDLTAFGFKVPRNIEDNPIKIPSDLFFGGEINWNKSELKSQNLEFSGVRIFENLNPVIDLSPNNPKIAQKQISDKSETAKNPNFADLDPELHINEEKAAKYLGISPRTLQGYRLNGGGPEYLKLKKAVRYKIRDLIEWSEKNKRENTSMSKP